MYKKVLGVIACLFVAVCLMSCEEDELGYSSSNKYNVIGVWSGHYYMPTGTRVNGEYVFNYDGTGTYERWWKTTYAYAQFVWTIKGNTIQCEGVYSDSEEVRAWKRNITLDSDGNSFYDGGITYSKN